MEQRGIRVSFRGCVAACLALAVPLHAGEQWEAETLPGTKALAPDDALASRLVDGIDRFLLREIEASAARRAALWRRDLSSGEAYAASLAPQRARLAHILGVRDARVPFDAPLVVATTAQPALAGRGEGFEAYAVRWPAFGDVHGEGLLLVPAGGRSAADVIAIPDAGLLPEDCAGLANGMPPGSQYARMLAQSGCRVLVPLLINREAAHRTLSNREFLYRSAFELGRHIIGYEVQKILAAVDWCAGERPGAPIGVIGWGEGGLLALAAGALDTRIAAVCASGYFEPRERMWEEPLYRNVFGFLELFGDAELAAMIAPRALVIETARGPEIVVPPGTGGGPGRLATPSPADVAREVERARALVAGLTPPPVIALVASDGGRGPCGSPAALSAFLAALAPGAALSIDAGAPAHLRPGFDPRPRHAAQMHELDRHTQQLLAESPYVRARYFAGLDTSTPERFAESSAPYREYFREEVIGRFARERLDPAPRTRRVLQEPAYTLYEVVLDVFPDVLACGLLLIPRDMREGERRPAVVCQHGLEGRPSDLADPRVDNPAYNRFGCRLAERGFVVFAPQNPYIFGDRFRALQRKANPLKKTLFSIIVPQHEQIVAWLGSLPFVDSRRIAFYGLSYGGKSAMRIPPLVPGYCLSICSADFNDWVWKNASTRSPYSYVWTGEYEIFEFDLGSTFNYAEMAALIAPRPFMVERGHFDGVAPDEAVAYEFAKVRHLYNARLGIGDRCAIEWFAGPHTIHGAGTFEFLHRHLAWPKR